LRVSAPEHEPQTITFTDAPPPRSIELRKIPPAAPAAPAAPTASAQKRKGAPQTAAPQPSPSPGEPGKTKVGANQAPIIKE
jgi:hypothetical protein